MFPAFLGLYSEDYFPQKNCSAVLFPIGKTITGRFDIIKL
jgi:hypothetical protein